jgi:hypothetical protein
MSGVCYPVDLLTERHGDTKLTNLLETLAELSEGALDVHDGCEAVYKRLR